LNSMLSLNCADPLFDQAKDVASRKLAEAETSMGSCRFLDEDTMGLGSDGNEVQRWERGVQEDNVEEKDFEEKLDETMEYIQELQMMTTSVNRMNIVRDEMARAMQHSIEEMSNIVQATERNSEGERFYEDRKERIARLLDVIDAADEFSHTSKGVDTFHWNNRGSALDLHKAVSKTESAFHSLYGKEIQRRQADMQCAKALLKWCQDLAKEIRELPSDGNEKEVSENKEFDAHVEKMGLLVARGEKSMRGSGEEFAEAWSDIEGKMEEIWVDARALDKRRKEDQRLRWSQLIDTFDSLKGTTKKEREVDDEESYKAVQDAKASLGDLQQAIKSSRREFDDAEWEAQKQIKRAEEVVIDRKVKRAESKKRGSLFSLGRDKSGSADSSISSSSESSAPPTSRPPRIASVAKGKSSAY